MTCPSPPRSLASVRNQHAPRLALIALVAFLVVALLAGAIALVVGAVGGGRNDSPLSTNSIRQGAERLENKEPKAVPVSNAFA